MNLIAETQKLQNYLKAKDFKTVVYGCEKLINKFPNSLEAYPNLASVLLAKGRSDIAKKILKKTIEINPNYLKPYSNLTIILSEKLQTKEVKDGTKG